MTLPLVAFSAKKFAVPPPTKSTSVLVPPMDTVVTVAVLATPTLGGLQFVSVVTPRLMAQTLALVLTLVACSYPSQEPQYAMPLATAARVEIDTAVVCTHFSWVV